jgi:uncharacterized protein (UPF0276 family)
MGISHPNLGFGLGLRASHYPYILQQRPPVDWFEVISENFMDTDGRPKRNLARIKEHYPIILHGVSLSIGTVDPLNSDYLRKLKALIDWVQPAWVSDHLCWTGVAHKNTHDLLPVPYTEEALKHIIQRIKEVQDYLGRPIALENPSTYLEFRHSTMPEAEFIARMAEASGCQLLLDVNNVYVTCYNHRLDPKTYLDTLPLARVIQIHLSGHSNKGSHIIDTHDAPVIDDVWSLYQYVVQKAGRVPNTMVEWDDHIPEFPTLLAELDKAREAAGCAALYHLPAMINAQPQATANDHLPLASAQQHMQEAIMQGDAWDSAPESWIRTKEGFSPAEQLAVYANAYRFRLRDVVAEDYPVLKTYLGDDAFNTLIRRFVETHQPQHFNIARFALKLPGFVAHERPDDVFALELCQLETELAQLADAAETPALTPAQLAGLDPQQLMDSVLRPRQALRLLAYAYPVNDYYRAVMDGESPEAPPAQASFLAIFRHDDTMWRLALEKDEYHLLALLCRGSSVGEALDSLDPAAAEALKRWFARWMQNGLLAAVEPATPNREGIHHEAA